MRFYSANFAEAGIIETSLDALKLSGDWSDYPVGVILALKASGYELPHGADFYYHGNLPDGAGLSSSAAIEVLTTTVLKELFALPVSPQQIALISQEAENRFIGLNCGIMDQFTSAMGKRDHAILLDTDTLEYAYAPLPSDKIATIIVNTGVKHALASSAYNDRRKECEAALKALKAPTLCSLSPDEFEQKKRLITDEICRKRAKHTIYENQRVLDMVEALKKGDYATCGELMKRSHLSLRDDYEVSCEELDFLAKTAWDIEGVYGARMTGGGFGGCTVNLVDRDRTEAFIQVIRTAYRDRFGVTPEVYQVQAGDGARRL